MKSFENNEGLYAIDEIFTYLGIDLDSRFAFDSIKKLLKALNIEDNFVFQENKIYKKGNDLVFMSPKCAGGKPCVKTKNGDYVSAYRISMQYLAGCNLETIMRDYNVTKEAVQASAKYYSDYIIID